MNINEFRMLCKIIDVEQPDTIKFHRPSYNSSVTITLSKDDQNITVNLIPTKIEAEVSDKRGRVVKPANVTPSYFEVIKQSKQIINSH